MKTKVHIEGIEWLDEDGLEAEVHFKINGNSYWAYSFPCIFKEGVETSVYISYLEEEIGQDVFWNFNNVQKETKLEEDFNSRTRYFVYGRITGIQPLIIQCGDFKLPNGDWINDNSVVGNYVYFVIARLDIFPA